MKFTLEIELGNVVNTPVDVAELLTFVLNEIREDGFKSGAHDVNTRSLWRQSEDGESTELIRTTVGKWEVTDRENTCRLCQSAEPEYCACCVRSMS